MPPSSADTSPSYSHSAPVGFTQEHLAHINQRLAKLSPEKILEWAIVSLPGLIQTTAFGLTGLVILDMINRISYQLFDTEDDDGNVQHLVPVVFLDTLYHFPETIDLADRVSKHYGIPVRTYKPIGFENAKDFEAEHGEKLWEQDEATYDYLVKVEPGRRAYDELGALAIITGRRRSQRGDRGSIDILEVEEGTGLIKLNPLANWSYEQVWTYIRAYQIPYNALVDQGYRSIGDWHSTRPPIDPNDERSGRWADTTKSECGLHKDYFKMREAYLASQKRKAHRKLEIEKRQNPTSINQQA